MRVGEFTLKKRRLPAALDPNEDDALHRATDPFRRAGFLASKPFVELPATPRADGAPHFFPLIQYSALPVRRMISPSTNAGVDNVYEPSSTFFAIKRYFGPASTTAVSAFSLMR